jgi:alkylation response protein AidB-like acyl-CoA dehydrogenase
MNFEYSENQQMIAQTVKDFAEKHIRPYVMEWERNAAFSRGNNA